MSIANCQGPPTWPAWNPVRWREVRCALRLDRRRLKERIHGRPRSDRKKRFLLSAVAPSTSTRHPRKARPINWAERGGPASGEKLSPERRGHISPHHYGRLVTRWLVLRTALLFVRSAVRLVCAERSIDGNEYPAHVFSGVIRSTALSPSPYSPVRQTLCTACVPSIRTDAAGHQRWGGEGLSHER